MVAKIEIKEEKGFSFTFLQRASSILGDTSGGLSGPKIIDIFCAYAERWNVQIPFFEYPYGVRRKSEILHENLKSFSSGQQFLIISELCDLRARGRNATAREELKLELYSKYGYLRPETDQKELETPLIEETRHWLQQYPDALKLFDDAKLKYDHGSFERNLLDDLRLALELLLKEILNNTKRLELQEHDLSAYLKSRGTPSEIKNMLIRLLDYYGKYQNDFVKHNDKPREEDIELVFELTASLMKHLVRIASS